MMIDYKKLGWAAGAAAASYALLAYVIPGLLSVRVVSVAGAVTVGYLVYTQVAAWELKALVDKLEAEAKNVIKKI